LSILLTVTQNHHSEIFVFFTNNDIIAKNDMKHVLWVTQELACGFPEVFSAGKY